MQSLFPLSDTQGAQKNPTTESGLSDKKSLFNKFWGYIWHGNLSASSDIETGRVSEVTENDLAFLWKDDQDSGSDSEDISTTEKDVEAQIVNTRMSFERHACISKTITHKELAAIGQEAEEPILELDLSKCNELCPQSLDKGQANPLLQTLAAFPHLTSLNLSQTLTLRDEDMEAFVKLLPSLKALNLRSSALDLAELQDKALQAISKLTELRSLNISAIGPFSKEGIRCLLGLKNLKILKIFLSFDFSQKMLMLLVNELPRLRSLDVSLRPEVNLKPLSGLEQLEHLKLSCFQPVSTPETFLVPLAEMTHLKTLAIRGYSLTDSHLQRLTCPLLQKLTFFFLDLNEANLECLASHKNLTYLSIRYCRNFSNFEALLHLTNLKTLRFEYIFTDEENPLKTQSLREELQEQLMVLEQHPSLNELILNNELKEGLSKDFLRKMRTNKTIKFCPPPQAECILF
jgi:hypothetical protein